MALFVRYENGTLPAQRQLHVNDRTSKLPITNANTAQNRKAESVWLLKKLY